MPGTSVRDVEVSYAHNQLGLKKDYAPRRKNQNQEQTH